MAISAIITLVVIVLALVFFATEWLSIDLVALLAMTTLAVTGVISPQESISGFSNSATITVAFMFVISEALLKTGALQHLAHYISGLFTKDYRLGVLTMMLLIAFFSAFINNTPVVAVFIPVMIQIAYRTGIPATKLLIPLSFASILGGCCTLIGTSTNILVSGIAESNGLPGFSMFQLLPMGLVFLVIGVLYISFIGIRLLPNRRSSENLKEKFGMRDYIAEIQLTEGAVDNGKRIMDSMLVNDIDMDIIGIQRHGLIYPVPAGDFILEGGDIIKVRCNIEKIKTLKERVKIIADSSLVVGSDDLLGKETSLIELVVTADSPLESKTLKELDFRHRFRAIPLAIRHREEILHEGLYNVPLKAGDVVLMEVKNHFLEQLKQMEAQSEAPFVLLSEDRTWDFHRRQFMIVAILTTIMILLASLEIVPILLGVLTVACLLVLSKCMSMKEVYRAINWKIIFLLAGSLSIGTAMKNSGLDLVFSGLITDNLGVWGPIAILSGLYLGTSLITEIMSNNATAALFAPIAIAIANDLGMSPLPFLMAVTFAASNGYMTPIGYQTNTMVFSAGNYRFTDFTRVGVAMNLVFWLLASLLIPVFYPF
ncbi:MAG TPA: SLC13 family permease [Saprospiraceae bacterium]|nr:SLC13 family permease [Saprospiraceae bacterium]HMQ83045.1 SLC13 family permease [Saprospiraceae bacterium]